MSNPYLHYELTAEKDVAVAADGVLVDAIAIRMVSNAFA